MFTHVDLMITVHSEEREHHHKKSNMEIGLLWTKCEKKPNYGMFTKNLLVVLRQTGFTYKQDCGICNQRRVAVQPYFEQSVENYLTV